MHSVCRTAYMQAFNYLHALALKNNDTLLLKIRLQLTCTFLHFKLENLNTKLHHMTDYF